MILRTRQNGDAMLLRRDWLAVWIGTWFGPAICLGLPAAFLLPYVDQHIAQTAVAPIVGLFFAQLWAPVVGIVAVPLGLLIGLYLLRIGWAGWAISILLPMVLTGLVVCIYAFSGTGYSPGTYLITGVLFAASAALHGGFAWLILRLIRPESLVDPTSPPQN